MLYWVTGAIHAAFWPYYARRHGDWEAAGGPRIDVPTAYSDFPREIVRPPRSMAERVFNIQRWTPMDRGGHFAAWSSLRRWPPISGPFRPFRG